MTNLFCSESGSYVASSSSDGHTIDHATQLGSHIGATRRSSQPSSSSRRSTSSAPFQSICGIRMSSSMWRRLISADRLPLSSWIGVARTRSRMDASESSHRSKRSIDFRNEGVNSTGSMPHLALGILTSALIDGLFRSRWSSSRSDPGSPCGPSSRISSAWRSLGTAP